MTADRKKSLFSLLFITAIDNFGFSLVFVMFAPLLLSPEYHFLPEATSTAARNVYLGVLFAAYPITQFFGAPLLGDYADRVGRKKALVISVIGTIVGFAFSGIASLFASLWFLIASRLFTGFFAGNLSICMSGLADLSPTEKERSKNFTIMGIIWGITYILAMLVGGYLSDPAQSKYFNPAVPFWITSLLTLLCLIVLSKFFHETHQTKEGGRFNPIQGLRHLLDSLRIKEVRSYFLVILLWTIGWGLSVQWYSAYSILNFGISQQEISWGLIMQGLFWMLGGTLLNPLLLKRYNSLPIAFISLSITSLFLFLSFLPGTFFFFSLFYWISAAFASFGFSNSMNLASINAPEAVQGKIMGISQSMMAFAWILVPLIGGFMGGKAPGFFYAISGTFLLIGALILLGKMHKTPS